VTDGTRAEALIVGGGGQDAQFLTRAINARGEKVVNLSKNQLMLNDSVISELEKVDSVLLEKILENYSPDFVYFTAANSYPAGQRSIKFDSEYVRKNDIVEKLLTECLTAIQNTGRKIKLVYFSSALRFGEMFSTIDEKSIPNPVEPYGEHKLNCENIVHEYVGRNSNIEFLIPYFFNHTSNLSKETFLLKKISSAVQNHDKTWLLTEYFAAKNNSNYIDIGSAKEYMDTLLELTKSKNQGSYVFSTGITLPVSYFFQAGLKLLDEDNSFEPCMDKQVPFTADNSKLRATLKLPENAFMHGSKLLEEILIKELAK
jgi:GDP-D-mannose dehydratase